MPLAAAAVNRSIPSSTIGAGRSRTALGQSWGINISRATRNLKVLAAPRYRPHLQAACSLAVRLDDAWSVAGLSRLRERVERHGIKLEMAPLPLGSTPTASAANPNIMRGKSPERDREIDDICQMIRNAGKVGIPALKYNLTLLGVVRTGSTVGRGGARYSTFIYSKSKANDPPPLESGPASADQMWERIEYFLKRVVPVAQEHKVRLCCHPHDPGMPPDRRDIRGIQRGARQCRWPQKICRPCAERFFTGSNFCQGTVAGNARTARPRHL